MNKTFTVLIPSRLASTRLPHKPLAKIGDKSLIQRVYEKAIKTTANNVYIATDADEIINHVKTFTNNVIMTSSNHISGTDRIHEAANNLNLAEDEIIVNLQGDEPFIPVDLINSLATDFVNSSCDVGTVINPFSDDEDVQNIHSVKVAISNSHRALYFSRSQIPNDFTRKHPNFYRHIGIYAYQKSTLDRIVNLAPSKLELSEKLEQLRFLENGYSISTTLYDADIPPGIDTPEDLQKAIDFIKYDN